MNHLVGLEEDLSSSANLAEDLPDDEAKILAKFRAAFNAKQPRDHHPLPPLTHQIASTSSLPPCGWRPLDDATLYRFLCADREKGQLQPEVSLKRLLNALQFRVEHRVDEILTIKGSRYCPIDDAADSKREQFNSTTTATSILVGTFMNNNNDDKVIEVTVQTTPSKSKPKFPNKSSQSFSSSSTTVSSTATTITTPTISTKSPLSFPSSPITLTQLQKYQRLRVRTPTIPKSPISFPSSPISLTQLRKYQRLRVRIFVGQARNGSPIMFERLGAFMGSGNTHLFTMEEWIQLYIWDLERHLNELRQASINSGRPIEKYMFWGDLEGILGSILKGSIWGVIPLLKALVKTVEEHYPEIVSHVVVFHVPKLALVVWEAIKVFLDPVTAAKVQLHGGFPKELALEMMDKSVLPKDYGGTNAMEYPKTAKK